MFDAVKWIIDNLLKLRKENHNAKKEKWIQVADYLLIISDTIEVCVEGFRKNKAPEKHHAMLVELHLNFDNVISQVLIPEPKQKSNQLYSSNYIQFSNAFSDALYLMDVESLSLSIAPYSPDTEFGKNVLKELEVCAAKFRALSVTLKAMA